MCLRFAAVSDRVVPVSVMFSLFGNSFINLLIHNMGYCINRTFLDCFIVADDLFIMSFTIYGLCQTLATVAVTIYYCISIDSYHFSWRSVLALDMIVQICMLAQTCLSDQLPFNPLDARRRYTDFPQVSQRRQTAVYRPNGFLQTPPADGIPSIRFVGHSRRPTVYNLCFLMHTGPSIPDSQRYRQHSS